MSLNEELLYKQTHIGKENYENGTLSVYVPLKTSFPYRSYYKHFNLTPLKYNNENIRGDEIEPKKISMLFSTAEIVILGNSKGKAMLLECLRMEK